MKKLLFTGAFMTLLSSALISQILCINCYRQNGRLSTTINNKVTNGSFENSNCTPWSNQGVFCPNASNYTCNVVAWTCTGGGSSSYACLIIPSQCAIPNGTLGAYLGNGVNAVSCSTLQADTNCLGTNQCTLATPPPGYPSTTGVYGGTTGISLMQPITGLTIGSNYVLEFWAGGEYANGNFIYRGLFAVDLGFGKTFLSCYPTGPTGTGTRFVIQFKATATTHSITFTNWGHLTAKSTEVVLDDVTLYAQSELSSAVAQCGNLTGIQQLSSNDNVLVPNPFSTCTELRSERLKEGASVVLYNIAGKEIKRLAPQNSGRVDICREELTAGIYYLVIEGDRKSRSVQKLVICD